MLIQDSKEQTRNAPVFGPVDLPEEATLDRHSWRNWILVTVILFVTTTGLAAAILSLLEDRGYSPWPWSHSHVALLGALVAVELLFIAYLTVQERRVAGPAEPGPPPARDHRADGAPLPSAGRHPQRHPHRRGETDPRRCSTWWSGPAARASTVTRSRSCSSTRGRAAGRALRHRSREPEPGSGGPPAAGTRRGGVGGRGPRAPDPGPHVDPARFQAPRARWPRSPRPWWCRSSFGRAAGSAEREQSGRGDALRQERPARAGGLRRDHGDQHSPRPAERVDAGDHPEARRRPPGAGDPPGTRKTGPGRNRSGGGPGRRPVVRGGTGRAMDRAGGRHERFA